MRLKVRYKLIGLIAGSLMVISGASVWAFNFTAGQKKTLVDFKQSSVASSPSANSDITGLAPTASNGNLSAAKASSKVGNLANKVLIPPPPPASSVIIGSSGPGQVAIALQGSTDLRGQALYIDPSLASQGRETQIASQPIAKWFGDFTPDVQSAVNSYVSAATAQGKLGTLVAYNIPERDCGSYSSGGAANAADYQAWIQAFAQGIGQRQAIVILEPDALPGMDCLSAVDQQQRLASIADAVNVLAEQTKAYVYIDAGNVSWQSPSTMALRLKEADIGHAQGFSLNVSGFQTTLASATYGENLSSLLGGKHYVIDTSRNGNGPAPGNAWCNPPGRALGVAPTTATGYSHADAYLWIKVPGESDGTCNGGPPAGQWFDDYARELINNSL